MKTATSLDPARHFKPHLRALERYRTSTGRDLEDGLCLDRNERVTPFPPKVMRDLRKVLTSGLLNYYPDPGPLYEKLSKFVGVPQDQLYLVNGITEGIRVLYETLTKPGDEVVVVDPTYPMYRVYSKAYEVAHKPIRFDENLELRLDEAESLIGDKTVFVCVPNPNLPVESYVEPARLKRLAALCRERGAFLVVDEAYGFFGAESVLPFLAEFDNLIVMQTCSKAFGLAGARMGWMISSKRNIEYLSKTRGLVESNSLSMAATEYMLDHPSVMRDYSRAVRQGRDELRRGLDALGVRWLGGDRTNAMLVFLKDNPSVTDLVAHMRAKKIYVRAAFDKPFDRCVRITLGPAVALRAFLRELKAWAKKRPEALRS